MGLYTICYATFPGLLSRSKTDQDISDNRLLISGSGIIDSCGIVSHANSIESTEVNNDCIISNECSRDKEEVPFPISSLSHERLILKEKSNVETKKGLQQQDSIRVRPNHEACFNQEQLEVNKSKLG